jgi:hypothetical protein
LLDENSNNPKACWSLVKKVMGNCRSTVIPPLINPVTNDIVVNESDKANVLNNYFCSISSTANNIESYYLLYSFVFCIYFDYIQWEKFLIFYVNDREF